MNYMCWDSQHSAPQKSGTRSLAYSIAPRRGNMAVMGCGCWFPIHRWWLDHSHAGEQLFGTASLQVLPLTNKA